MNTSSSQADGEAGKRILVPVDFSDRSHEVVERAVAEAKQHHGSITILFVADFIYQTRSEGPANWNRIFRKLSQDAQDQFLKLQREYKETVSLDLAIESGFAQEVIPQYARDHSYDLIVIAQRPHHWWQLFRRHTAERVLKNSTVPVVLLDGAKEQGQKPPRAGFGNSATNELNLWMT